MTIPIRLHSAHIGITRDKQEYYTQKKYAAYFLQSLRCQGCYNQKKFTGQFSSGLEEFVITRYTKLLGRDCARIWNGISLPDRVFFDNKSSPPRLAIFSLNITQIIF